MDPSDQQGKAVGTTPRYARFWLDEDGFLRGEALPEAEETLADAHESFRVLDMLRAETRRPLLMDITGVRSISRDARRYYGGPEVLKRFTAIAIVGSSPLSRAMGNFFLG